LRERSLLLAGRILEFDPALRGGSGVQRARELLESGAAARQFDRIIAAQGPLPPVPIGSLSKELPAAHDGVVTGIDCYRIARIARMAGAPTDKGAGVDLFKKVGDPVMAGEPLYRIHAEHNTDFHFATQMAEADIGFQLSERK
jgi:thymidine phosphorylase